MLTSTIDFSNIGGAGGGVILLTTNTLTVNGNLSSNGGDSTANGSGGGSGGSILIYVTSLAGNGSIHVDGGSGSMLGSDNIGGGGSGGRIAVHFYQNSFNGSMSSIGGSCGDGTPAGAGGPGTVFTMDYTTGYRRLSISNGKHPLVTYPITSMASTRGSYAWLTDHDVQEYEFDEISLTNNAGLALGTKANISTSEMHYLTFLTNCTLAQCL